MSVAVVDWYVLGTPTIYGNSENEIEFENHNYYENNGVVTAFPNLRQRVE